jgi:hypothetical protein
MFNAQGKLDIFENFRVDRTLPKYKEDSDNDGIMSKAKFSGNLNPIEITEDDGYILASDGTIRLKQRKTWFQCLFRRKKKEPKPKITVEQFFSSIHNSVLELEVVKERARGYRVAIGKAIASGQKALLEQLTQGLEAVRAETQLIATGNITYLEEDTLVSFVKQAPKGLRLDWIANFTRVIPDSVLQTKLTLDKRFVFDNYVVLHFDPEKKSWAETEKEKEARRDPILFGVVKGKRRLYFVGDWVDEMCDLTLDQIADSVGVSKLE